eukprot:620583-Hanusia_phi.AAC.1
MASTTEREHDNIQANMRRSGQGVLRANLSTAAKKTGYGRQYRIESSSGETAELYSQGTNDQ